MLESYFSLLIKAIELIAGTRTHIKNRKEGCKGLYILYLTLDEILNSSLEVRRELSDTLHEDRHREHVYISLDILLSATQDFAGRLGDLRCSIGIFDQSLAEDLNDLLGNKCLFLLYLCSHSSLVKKEEKKKVLLKISVTLKNLRSLPEKQSDYLRNLFICSHYFKEEEPPEVSAVIKKEYVPFDNKRRIEKLLQSIDKNIEQLRSSQQHLADFIKKNCRYSDLF